MVAMSTSLDSGPVYLNLQVPGPAGVFCYDSDVAERRKVGIELLGRHLLPLLFVGIDILPRYDVDA